MLDLSALGITPEALRAQIVEKAAEMLLENRNEGEDLFEIFDQRMRRAIEGKMTEIVNQTAREVVEPRVAALIESMTFQETNRYGEAQKPPKTWREKLIEMAEGWLGTTVDYNGKTQKEDSYNWKAHSTRVVFMVEKHLQFEISKAITAAVNDANSKIAGGILGATRIALQEALAGLKLDIKTK